MPPVFPLPSSLKKLLTLGAALAFCLTLGLASARAQESDKNQPSDEGSEAIQAIAKHIEENNFQKALDEAKKFRAKFKPDSFDYAYMCQMQAVALVQLKDITGSLEPFRTALELSNKHGYFTKAQNTELTFTVAQIYGQLASETKDPAGQQKYWGEAFEYARQWMTKTTKMTQDGVYFAAQAVYSKAAAGGSENLDKELMKQTAELCNKAMGLAIKPKEHAMLLLVAALQQLNRLPESSEYLELMVKLFPNNKSYWNQLANTYILIAEQQKEERARNESYLHAILTFERAQKIGLLNTPKDNYYLVGLLINTGQHDAAIDLMEASIRNGQLDGTEQNWQLLAQSYQEIKKDTKAIATLKEASKIFPKNSNFDVQIANLYYGIDKLPEALSFLRSAVAKGVDKPAPTQVFIAYIALELKKPEEAAAAAQEALKFDPKSADAKRLLESATAEIQEREQMLKTRGSATPAPKKN
ncbi:tetratricopeptide repeat protein [Nibricoccus sp. IMCC34717]|uniref:tetratricopeptide repeat protein n=1 Tax=Nibricoccus sp. IMCC34717 TaxID=3034021 RepID=UPI003850E934